MSHDKANWQRLRAVIIERGQEDVLELMDCIEMEAQDYTEQPTLHELRIADAFFDAVGMGVETIHELGALFDPVRNMGIIVDAAVARMELAKREAERARGQQAAKDLLKRCPGMLEHKIIKPDSAIPTEDDAIACAVEAIESKMGMNIAEEAGLDDPPMYAQATADFTTGTISPDLAIEFKMSDVHKCEYQGPDCEHTACGTVGLPEGKRRNVCKQCLLEAMVKWPPIKGKTFNVISNNATKEKKED